MAVFSFEMSIVVCIYSLTVHINMSRNQALQLSFLLPKNIFVYIIATSNRNSLLFLSFFRMFSTYNGIIVVTEIYCDGNNNRICRLKFVVKTRFASCLRIVIFIIWTSTSS